MKGRCVDDGGNPSIPLTCTVHVQHILVPVTLPVSMEFPEGPSVSSSVDPIELQGVRRDKVYLPDKVYLTRIGSSTDVHMNSHVFCHVVFLREHARYTINGSMYGCFFLFC